MQVEQNRNIFIFKTNSASLDTCKNYDDKSWYGTFLLITSNYMYFSYFQIY